MKKTELLFILAGLVIGAGLGLFLFSLLNLGRAAPGAAGFLPGRSLDFSPAVGNPAPAFELENLAGERVSLEDQRGKTVLINFWATWCGPCRLEMPAIQERYQAHAGDLAVLAVNFDEPVGEVRAYADELGVTFPILLDPGAAVQDAYRVRGYPTTYLVDREGVIQVVHIGLLTGEQLDRYLVQLGVTQ